MLLKYFLSSIKFDLMNVKSKGKKIQISNIQQFWSFALASGCLLSFNFELVWFVVIPMDLFSKHSTVICSDHTSLL